MMLGLQKFWSKTKNMFLILDLLTSRKTFQGAHQHPSVSVQLPRRMFLNHDPNHLHLCNHQLQMLPEVCAI